MIHSFRICIFIIASFVLLFITSQANAQNNNFVLEVNYLEHISAPTDRFSSANPALGITLGYRFNSFSNQHLSLALAGFFNLYGYDFPLTKPDITNLNQKSNQFDGATIFTGLEVQPIYCLNPEQDWNVSFALGAKFGNYYGWGNIYRVNDEAGRDYLERNKVNAGLGLAIIPKVLLLHRTGNGSIGVQFGWDSGDYGEGLRPLRSTYYQKINYRSSSLVFGVVVNLGISSQN